MAKFVVFTGPNMAAFEAASALINTSNTVNIGNVFVQNSVTSLECPCNYEISPKFDPCKKTSSNDLIFLCNSLLLCFLLRADIQHCLLCQYRT